MSGKINVHWDSRHHQMPSFGVSSMFLVSMSFGTSSSPVRCSGASQNFRLVSQRPAVHRAIETPPKPIIQRYAQ